MAAPRYLRRKPRYVDFRVTSRAGHVDRSDDTIHMQAPDGPSRIAQHHEGDCANAQILLVADIFVWSDQHIKSSHLGGFQQFGVSRACPSLSPRLFRPYVAFLAQNNPVNCLISESSPQEPPWRHDSQSFRGHLHLGE